MYDYYIYFIKINYSYVLLLFCNVWKRIKTALSGV